MATNLSERHIRLVFLLMKVGVKLTRRLLEKRVDESKPDPSQVTSWTLDHFLQKHKQQILTSRLGREKEKVYFPPSGKITDLEDWDLSMYCFILTRICRLSPEMLRDVEDLQKMRNKLCHASDPSVNEMEYITQLKKFELIKDKICKEVNDFSFTTTINDLVTSVKTYPLSTAEIVQHVHRFYAMETETQTILNAHSRDHEELLKGLKESSTKMDQHLREIKEGIKILPDLKKIFLQVTKEDSTKMDQQHGEIREAIKILPGPVSKMTASCRTTSDFKDSLLKGSDEDFTIYCNPCNTVGKFVEAKGFCVNCKENLCTNCIDVHKKMQAIKHHDILNKAQEVSSKTAPAIGESKVPSEFFKVHQKEVETRLDVSSVVHNINIRTMSDKRECYITGCAVVSADKLLLADRNNNKLKVVNIDTQSVVEEMTVDSSPWDVTVLPQDKDAVTLPYQQEILIVDTAGKLKTIRSIQVSRQCWGITYHQDHLYVVCWEPYSLLVLNMRGNVQKDIPLQTAQDQSFREPWYIAVSRNGKRLYISDCWANFVASVRLDGEIAAVYKDQELVDPLGLLVLGDESLLVCCGGLGTIHRIQADIKQGGTLTGYIHRARSICYHSGNHQIYVGSEDSNLIKVFTLQ